MDLTLKFYNENYSDPIEFLDNVRQTTEPIGGSTIYDKDGELVDYEAALLALDKCKNNVIKKATEWLKHNVDLYSNGTDIAANVMIADLTIAMKEIKYERI